MSESALVKINGVPHSAESANIPRCGNCAAYDKSGPKIGACRRRSPTPVFAGWRPSAPLPMQLKVSPGAQVPQEPIILGVFPTVGEACACLEWIDVRQTEPVTTKGRTDETA